MADVTDAADASPVTPVNPSGSIYRVQFSENNDDPRAIEEAIDGGNESHRSSAVYNRPRSRQLVRRRATSFHTVDAIDQSAAAPHVPVWAPGSEPGLGPDPIRPELSHGPPGFGSLPVVQCDVTVVDFSQSQVQVRRYDSLDSSNADFIHSLDDTAPSWAIGRWISVNGLSPDVVRAIGSRKGLHPLALEDLLVPRNRTKVDWYPAHAFIVLTLQKLVHIDTVSPPGFSNDHSSYFARALRALLRRFRRWPWPTGWRPLPPETDEDGTVLDPLPSELPPSLPPYRQEDASSSLPAYRPRPPMKTLQRYHGSPNQNRTQFMEEHSTLLAQDLVVMAEQVSIFLTSDNTVVSFFETSADDIEQPLLRRLCQPGTVLHESGDASLLVQAIIDAIVDLAVPVAEKYASAIDDLEVDVLTSPATELSVRLYVAISEISKMLSLLTPIDSVVNALRDHRSHLSQKDAVRRLHDPASGIVLTPMTYAYLGDVHDHCLIISEALTQTKQSAENLIALIFNNVSARQSNSMKLLTFITIIFLPLSFMTGLFGMNFHDFPDLDNNISYFWKVAIPTAFFTTVFVLWGTILNNIKILLRRAQVAALRRRIRREKELRASATKKA